MVRFDVLQPENLSEAISLLAEHKQKANLIAGGQNLLVLLRHRLIKPRYLVNIKNCSEMEYIKEDGDVIKIGALTTHRAIETSSLIQEKLPMLTELEHEVGCIQTRNWGTIAGNLCQASPTNDLAPALIALRARCLVKSVKGERWVSFDDFYLGYKKTALKSDEILTEIEISNLIPHTGGIYRKESVRFADCPIAAVGVVITLDEQEKVKNVRILLQAVGVTPIRAEKAEKSIKGKKIDKKILETAAEIAAGEAKPISDVYGSANYKREMVKILTKNNIKVTIDRAIVS